MPRPTPNGRYLGWRPSLPRHGRAMFASPLAMTALPDAVDLRDRCPPVFDQGQLGSCTAQALCAAVQFDRMRQNMTDAERPLSRLHLYWMERAIEGSTAWDAGAQGYDGITALRETGVCFEDLWPYDISRFAVNPPPACFQDGHRIGEALQLTQDIYQLRGCLAAGFPFNFGFTAYEELDSDAVAKSGDLPMPQATSQILAGHEVQAVGYDYPSRRFLVRNSWGDRWGMDGYFWMPFEYLLRPDLSRDFDTIRVVAS